MIKFEARYVNNAHRISDVALASTVTTLYDGQWLTLDANGEMIISTGAANTRSYITLSSKWGNFADNINRPITMGPAGRDVVTPTGRVTVLIGPYRLETDQYETDSYVAGAALKVSANGKLEPWVSGVDDASLIVAYVWKVPASATDTLGIIHE